MQNSNNDYSTKIVYTVDDIKNMLGIGKNQAYKLVNSGEFHVCHVVEGYHKSAEGKHPKRDRIEKRITGCLQCGSMTRDLRKKR